MKKQISVFDEKEVLQKVQDKAREIIGALLDLEYAEPEKEGKLKGIRLNALAISSYVRELLT